MRVFEAMECCGLRKQADLTLTGFLCQLSLSSVKGVLHII